MRETAGAVPADLRARVEAWMARDPDPSTRAELAELLADGDEDELAARFAGRLDFGTAGLRGAMGAGPARMNRLVVRESAAGIARYLIAAVPGAAEAGVIVARDARRRSDRFARDAAEVIAAHGLRVFLGAEPLPTPAAVHAIRHLGAAAAIVVTASHNPATDNGLKVYAVDGAQIVPPVDAEIAAAIEDVAARQVVVAESVMDAAGRQPPQSRPARVEPLPAEALEAYRARTLARVPPPAAPVRIATTAMHGVGGSWLAGLLAAAGHADVHPVAAQERPDPDFPTVPFPNPEEPGATDALAARMAEVGADLGLALDPDADRLAVLVPDPAAGGVPRRLTGDEVGALLGEWLLAEVTAGPDRLVVSSVVSSSMLAAIAAHHGAHHAETLTGFKWLSRPAMEHPQWTQVLAYEEAIGYAIGPDARDKDGLSAALAVASLAARLRADGRTPLDLLDAIDRRHGAHVTDNFSLRDESIGARAGRQALVARLSADPPLRVGPLRARDARALAPDVLRIDLDGARALVRPSGTEPKLKLYLEAVEPTSDGDVEAARARARRRLAALRAGLEELLAA